MVSMPAKYKYDFNYLPGVAITGSGSTGPNVATFIRMHQVAQFQVVELNPLLRSTYQLRICGPMLWNSINSDIINNPRNWHIYERLYKL